MIQRLLDEEKEQGGIAREVNTADAAGLVMSGILGACVMHSSNKSKKQLNATIAALISYLQSLSTKH
jgi:hypothetical protein